MLLGLMVSKASTTVSSTAHERIPAWLPVRRRIAVGLAVGYFFNSTVLAPSGWPASSEVILAVVTLLLWFLPWIWFRRGWLWWPTYGLSTLIVVFWTRTVMAAWVWQITRPQTPLFDWPLSLQGLFYFATLFTLFCVWHVAALGMTRLRPLLDYWRLFFSRRK